MLTDGAVCDPLPVDVAIQQGSEIILAMAFQLEPRRKMRSLTAVNAHLTTLYTNALLQAQFAFHNLARHAELIPILPGFDGRVTTFDTHHLPAIIEAGRTTAQKQMPYLRRLLAAE